MKRYRFHHGDISKTRFHLLERKQLNYVLNFYKEGLLTIDLRPE